MGIKEWYNKRFGSRDNIEKLESEEQTLAHKGIQILSDGKLEHRIHLLIQLEKEITKPIETVNLTTYIEELKDRTDILNNAILQIAMPYARSGNDPTYARKVRGWTQMYALATSWILQAEGMIPKEKTAENEEKAENDQYNLDNDEGNIEILIHMLHRNLQAFIWKDAFYFLGVCFMDVDIAPTAATVVQTMIPARGGEGLNTIPQPSTEY